MATTDSIIQELDNQIIEEYDLTRGQLKVYFDKVSNKENWKLPIDAVCLTKDVKNIEKAIIYFTGSVPLFTKMENSIYRVKAAGYYSAVGA